MSALDRTPPARLHGVLELYAEREEEGRPLTVAEMAACLGGGSGDYSVIRRGMIACGWLRMTAPPRGAHPMEVALTDAGWRALGRERPRATAARRTCLCCGRDFLSAWAGNRICASCIPVVERRQSCLL